MNTKEPWDAFCGTYEGIHSIFAAWDANHPGTDLSGEWKKFVNAELLDVVNSGKSVLLSVAALRKPVLGPWSLWWAARWFYATSILGPFRQVAITGTCPNL